MKIDKMLSISAIVLHKVKKKKQKNFGLDLKKTEWYKNTLESKDLSSTQSFGTHIICQ